MYSDEFKDFYDFDIESSANSIDSSDFRIKFAMLERENKTLRKNNARLRMFRNQYRQKTHQAKREMIRFQTQIVKQAEFAAMNSDEKHNIDKRFDVLRLNSHSFQRLDSAPPLAEPTFPHAIKPIIPASSAIALHPAYIKYPDIDDFYGDRDEYES